MPGFGGVLTGSDKSDRHDALTEPSRLADPAGQAEGIEGVAQLLAILRKQFAALGLPDSESAAELSQGLDIAWIGSRRLLIELALANEASGGAPNPDLQSPRPKSQERQRVV